MLIVGNSSKWLFAATQKDSWHTYTHTHTHTQSLLQKALQYDKTFGYIHWYCSLIGSRSTLIGDNESRYLETFNLLQTWKIVCLFPYNYALRVLQVTYHFELLYQFIIVSEQTLMWRVNCRSSTLMLSCFWTGDFCWTNDLSFICIVWFRLHDFFCLLR